MFICRLGADPETRTFDNGGKVCNLRVCVTNRKKDKSGNWVDDPCWIDASAWNRGDNGKTADHLSTLRKGSQVYLEGKLAVQEWEDKQGGGKRSKHVLQIDTFQFLDPKANREDSGDDGHRAPPTQQAQRRPEPQRRPAAPPPQADGYGDEEDDNSIPF